MTKLCQTQMGAFPWDPSGNIDRIMGRMMGGGYPAPESRLKPTASPIFGQVWSLMNECWQKDPEQRPPAESLLISLEAVSERSSA